jgi:glycosyltransferase involved in cell wall biosynthesis
MQRSVKRVQMTVALTNGDAKEWRKLTPKVCVIPNVVHLNESNTFSDCQLKTAIFVGRLCSQKDVFSLLRIWKNVHDQHPDWQLSIFGDGELKEEIQHEIDRLAANIHLFPSTINIMEKYKESSLLLMTSSFEPFGLVLPEAMSCGLPVVAFDCPYGPSDIITDGKDGFIIKDRSITEYADKVCQLIENYELRCNMGKAGILSSQKYAASRIMPQWIDLFMQLCIKNKQN